MPAGAADVVLCGKPALGPPDAEDPPLLFDPRDAGAAAAERVMAWRCWSNDT